MVEHLSGVRVIHMPTNGGFSSGCNAGWRSGSADLVLFLNPDAVLRPDDLAILARGLDEDPTAGLAGPRTVSEEGNLNYTIRRFPSLVSTYAQALFLHRVAPRASWVDEVVRDPLSYAKLARVDWLSGSCLLVRRSVLEAIGGLDDAYFFYSEDVDLCRRVWRDAGLAVVYCPDATCVHAGGRSRPRAQLLPMLAASRLRYARRHRGHLAASSNGSESGWVRHCGHSSRERRPAPGSATFMARRHRSRRRRLPPADVIHQRTRRSPRRYS